ncbi:MAG: aspartate aminotransferase family protein [Dehalococcoidia bacterium]
MSCDLLAVIEEPDGFGWLLPQMRVPPPGPRSRAMAEALARVESPAISTLANGDLPIFWEAAAGANVLDADGNVYIDTTSAFGVASVGHRNPAVVAAVAAQQQRLVHGMGDYLPPSVRLELATALQDVLPAGLGHVLFGTTGADAVELAVKCAAVYSGRPGVIAFEGGFHGQSYGALSLSSRPGFSSRFRQQLGIPVEHAQFPNPYRCPAGLSEAAYVERCLTSVRDYSAGLARRGTPAGCVVVEPFQGREGEIIPPATFLPRLRQLCDELGVLLVFDEIYTGFGRTGRMWAADHSSVLPDLICAGKALGGGFPGSIVAGKPEIMEAWRPDGPEAPHSSTFLGHPIFCVAALAVLRELKEGRLVERSRTAGSALLSRLRAATEGNKHVGDVRGCGMMMGVEVVTDRESRQPFPEFMPGVLQAGLERGLILLPAGTFGNVISIAPPFVASDEQLTYLAEELPRCLIA